MDNEKEIERHLLYAADLFGKPEQQAKLRPYIFNDDGIFFNEKGAGEWMLEMLKRKRLEFTYEAQLDAQVQIVINFKEQS